MLTKKELEVLKDMLLDNNLSLMDAGHVRGEGSTVTAFLKGYLDYTKVRKDFDPKLKEVIISSLERVIASFEADFEYDDIKELEDLKG